MPRESGFSPERFSERDLFEGDRMRFQSRLHEILNQELTSQNIDSLFEKMLDQLAGLSLEIREQYLSVGPSNENLSLLEIEDEAFVYYDMPKISILLDQIRQKIHRLKTLEEHVKKTIIQLESVHTPPSGGGQIVTTNESIFRERETRSRLKTLLYIIEEDFGIDVIDIEVRFVTGTNSPAMMRGKSYVSVVIPTLHRLVEINDELGNRTFVYDTQQLESEGMTQDQLRGMTKEEKITWLLQNLGVGRSLVETKKWRVQLSHLLSSDGTKDLVEEESEVVESQEDPMRVEIGEMHPFRGFWEDGDGKHWGAVFAISQYLGINPTSTRKILASSGLSTRDNELKNSINRPIEHAYCLEEVEALEKIKDLQEKRKKGVDKAASEDNSTINQLKGFFTDTEGYHWGSISAIAGKLGVDRKWLKKALSQVHDLRVKREEICDERGRLIEEAYCLEEMKLDQIEKHIEKKQKKENILVEETEAAATMSIEETEIPEENKFKNFYTDEEGRHWGTLLSNAKRLGINERSLTLILSRLEQKVHVKENEILGVRGKVIKKAYCLEELEAIDEIQQRRDQSNLDTIQVASQSNEQENQIEGFFTDEEGRHWGSIFAIATYLNVQFQTVQRAIEAETNLTIQEQRFRGTRNRLIDKAYCLEEVLTLENIANKIGKKAVAQENKVDENQIKGLFTDENGKHWGSKNSLAVTLNIKPERLTSLLKQISDLSAKENEILDLNSHLVAKAYCLEELQEHGVIVEAIENEKKRKNATGEVSNEDNPEENKIKGFYTDEQGKHWGSIASVAKQFDVFGASMRKVLKQVTSLAIKKDALLSQGVLVKVAYCLEEIQKNEQVQKLLQDIGKRR